MPTDLAPAILTSPAIPHAQKPAMRNRVHDALIQLRSIEQKKGRFPEIASKEFENAAKVMQEVCGQYRQIKIPDGFKDTGKTMVVHEAEMGHREQFRMVTVRLIGYVLTDSGRVTKNKSIINVVLAEMDVGKQLVRICNRSFFDLFEKEVFQLETHFFRFCAALVSDISAEDDRQRIEQLFADDLLPYIPVYENAIVRIDDFKMRLKAVEIFFRDYKESDDDWIELYTICRAGVLDKSGAEIIEKTMFEIPISRICIRTGEIEDMEMVEPE